LQSPSEGPTGGEYSELQTQKRKAYLLKGFLDNKGVTPKKKGLGKPPGKKNLRKSFRKRAKGNLGSQGWKMTTSKGGEVQSLPSKWQKLASSEKPGSPNRPKEGKSPPRKGAAGTTKILEEGGACADKKKTTKLSTHQDGGTAEGGLDSWRQISGKGGRFVGPQKRTCRYRQTQGPKGPRRGKKGYTGKKRGQI